eukprot:TRINITY_DN17050_c0_g1_i1.p1 TRINITY_DN17050_c0_g1~~TRINITY_DN17050_c0_g1_i1.p1  ORF type:complete len:361 (+),score=9.81 TRINITY_DN17050_c0_g1_i1:236-1318(+)
MSRGFCFLNVTFSFTQLVFILVGVIVCLSILPTSYASSDDYYQIFIQDEQPLNCSEEINGTIIIAPCNGTCNFTLDTGIYIPCLIPLTNATFNVTISCYGCPLGRFSNSKVQPNCSADGLCMDGTCVEGYSCIECYAGTYANKTNSTSCVPCPSGMVSPERGMAQCRECSAGLYSSPDKTQCIACLAGYFNPSSGASECQECGRGTYSGVGFSECFDCSRGTYNPLPGQANCLNCGAGFYGSAMGMESRTSCQVCPGGTYCPELANPAPVPCPKNYYCKPGATIPISCPTLYISDDQAEDCHAGPGFYLLIAGSVGVLILVVVMLWRRHVTAKARQTQNRKMEIDRLIPKPREGPVYRGL